MSTARNNVARNMTRRVFASPKVKLNSGEDGSYMAHKINSQSWPGRIIAMSSPEGYVQNNHTLKIKSLNDWVAALNLPNELPTWFIDGTFIYTGVAQNGKFLRFPALNESQVLRKPIRYFCTLIQENIPAQRLLASLERAEFQIFARRVSAQTLMAPPAIEISEDRLINLGRERERSTSFISEMVAQIIYSAMDEEPEIDHVLVMTDDPQIIPAIKILKEMEIITTLGILPTRPCSNYFLQQFDHIIKLPDLFRQLNALQDRQERDDF